MNTMQMGVLIIGAATYLSVAGALAFRKFGEKNQTDFSQFHSMADPMLNVVATLFSILLGFLVAGAMDRYNDTQSQCEVEALKLADVYALARGMKDGQRKPLQAACVEYCDAVMKDEWPKMALSKTSPLVWKANKKIWDAALVYEPDGDRETDIHQSLLDAVRDLGESRRSRIVAMRQHLSPALWIVVIGGSIILMACTYMFFIENPRLQGLMIALVALSLALNVFLLAVYSSPFVGDLKITPEAFELDSQTFDRGSAPLQFLTHKKSKSSDDDDDDSDDTKSSAKNSADKKKGSDKKASPERDSKGEGSGSKGITKKGSDDN